MADTKTTTITGAQITSTFSHNQIDDLPFSHPVTSALPTASATYRGHTAIVYGNGTTTADTYYICLMSSTGTYSWKSVISG